VGILTSGGDAPGMNAVIAEAAEAVERRGGEACAVHGGFAGLAEGRLGALAGAEAKAHADDAGTWLGTSRWPALETADGLAACRRAVAAARLDALAVIGGHGSALAARALAGDVAIGFVPATIDGDVPGTEVTIGTGSAIALAVTTIGRLRVTARSLPGRGFVVQTLGAPRGFLATAVAEAAGIDPALVLVPERPLDLDALAAALAQRTAAGTAIAVMSEAVGDAVRVCEALSERAGIRVHPTILGHAQRAATPSAEDRALGEAAGRAVADALAERRSCFVALARDGTATTLPLTAQPLRVAASAEPGP
jgi:6-phosphofructokinase 1